MDRQELIGIALNSGAEFADFSSDRTLLDNLDCFFANSVLVTGLSVRDPLLTQGIRYPGWSKSRQFIDTILNDISLKICESLNIQNIKTKIIDSSDPAIDIRALAMDAGLGYKGKNGLLIHPEFGPRIRFGGIIIDLSVAPGSKDTNSCNGCSLCVENCPPGAISEKGLDISTCSDYNRFLEKENGLIIKKCSICTDVCPEGKER